MRQFRTDEPFFLQWHITDRCDLACRHCYREAPRKESGLADLRRVWENFLDLRKDLPHERARVQVAGGEPLLSPHLFDILDWAAAAGFPTRLFTNGQRVDRGTARDLKAHGCRIVQVSIEGLGEAHDAVRGSGSFEKALEGARLLREAGIQVTFAVTLTRTSAPQLRPILGLAAEAADRAGFHRLVPCGSARGLADEMLKPAELREAYAQIHRFKTENPVLEIPLRDPLWKPYLGCTRMDCRADGCSAGYAGICVESDGTVYACRRMPVPLGNALETPLAGIWKSGWMERIRDRDRLKGNCGRCPLRWRCGGCRAVAWALTGDPWAEDPQCFFRPSFLERLGWKALAAAADLRAREGGG